VVFYRHVKSGRLTNGFPDQFAAPPGFEKIVCTTAADVDRYSQKLREQERRDEQMTDEQREAVEGPIRDYVRKELVTRMLTARNQINRDFCKWALDRMDEQERRRKMKRETFMHIEGFSEGH
jgi:hypothetical protein